MNDNNEAIIPKILVNGIEIIYDYSVLLPMGMKLIIECTVENENKAIVLKYD